MPRFGHTDDFFEAIFGDRVDYIRGTIFIPAFIFTFLIIWCLVILVLKVRGEKSGILSGREFIHEKEGCCECGRLGRNAVVRLTVLLSAIALVLCAAIFPTKGANAVQKTIDTIRSTAEVSVCAISTIVYRKDILTYFDRTLVHLQMTELQLQIS